MRKPLSWVFAVLGSLSFVLACYWISGGRDNQSLASQKAIEGVLWYILAQLNEIRSKP